MKRWYAVHTQPRAEKRAEIHLRNQGFSTFLPKVKGERRHARRVDQVVVPLFAGYLFVELDVESTSWRCINGTHGVRRLVCHGNSPAPVPHDVVDKIRSREDSCGVVELCPQLLRKGDRCRISTGPLSDVEAIFEELSGVRRAVLLLELLGRSVRVSVPVRRLVPVQAA